MSIEAATGAPQAETSPRYLALDALRGAAALAVLFYHLRNLKAPDQPDWGRGLFASGYLAVDLFFVLSGFVIAHAYGNRLGRSMTIRAFLIVRFIRLQPVIAIGTLMGLAFALVQRVLGLPGAPGLFAAATSLPLNLALLPNVLLPWSIFLFNPPAWSLFYEGLANTLYAWGVTKWARGPALSIRFEQWLVALCIAGLAGLIGSVLLTGDLDHGVDLPDAPVALSRIAFSFSLGLLLHRTRERWMGRMPRVQMPWLLLACLLLLAPELQGPVRQLYDLAFAAAFSPLLVMLGAVIEPEVRTRNAAHWLGFVSYPLYATHAPVKHFTETFLPLPFAPLLLVTVGVSLGVAWFVAAWIDPPIRRWLSALAHSRMTASPPLVAATQLPGAN